MTAIVIIISANIEWESILNLFTNKVIHNSPFGDWFEQKVEADGWLVPVIFYHGGWGKISSAASTQCVIDKWSPYLLINLGTCGGFEGKIERGTIILVDQTVVYDIIEQMADYDEHTAHYSTQIDLSWIGDVYPIPVKKTLLVSGDRDLIAVDIPSLESKFNAIAGDWESGAIAWVARRNGIKLLILRGVTDLVGSSGGEAYGNITLFRRVTKTIMRRLVESLPGWIKIAENIIPSELINSFCRTNDVY